MILGGGFAGLHAARAFRGANVDVTIVDATNHHLFQPLLYQVATATVAPTDITAPIRWLVRTHRNTKVVLAQVVGIDVALRVVRLRGAPFDLPYDYLLVALGARHAYFGHDDWESSAPGLKTLDDAIEVRRRFLLAFERAEWCDDPRERDALLTFVIVGGGPTGVELAGMLPAVARGALRADFRRIDAGAARVILLEAGPRLLASFAPDLAERAKRDLEELGVDVRLGALVTHVDATGVHVGDTRIGARTVLWAAGNAASPIVKSLGVSLDGAGRVRVKADLSIPEHPEIFAAGDVACIEQDGAPVPGVAPAAMQAGRAAARNILRLVAGQPTKPFRYWDKGSLATIGRHRGLAQFGRVHVAGPLAWWMWLCLHILYLAGFRNRISVLVEWAYAYVTYGRGARVITRPRQSVARPRSPEIPADH